MPGYLNALRLLDRDKVQCMCQVCGNHFSSLTLNFLSAGCRRNCRCLSKKAMIRRRASCADSALYSPPPNTNADHLDQQRDLVS